MSSVLPRRLAALTMIFALMFSAACDGETGPAGPTGPQGMQGTQGDPGTSGDPGPQGDQGAQGEPGEPGVDGNANVTIHIFGGHDFTSDAVADLCLGEAVSQQEFVDSSWTVYLGIDDGAFESVYAYVPGMAYGGEYLTVRAYDANAVICPTPQPLIDVALASGPGEVYDEIRIIQVLANEVVDHTIAAASSVAPNMTDYDAVIEHFGHEVTEIRH